MIARELHKMPEEIENMSEYWFNRMVVFLDAEALDRQRRNDEMERENRRRR